MKTTVKTLVVTAILLAGCSSSNNNNNAAPGERSDPQGNVPTYGNPGNTQTDGGGTGSPGTSIDFCNIFGDTLHALAGYELETLSAEKALVAYSVVLSAISRVTLPTTKVILVDQTLKQSFPVTSFSI